MPETGFSKIKIVILVIAVAVAGVTGFAITQIGDKPEENAKAAPGSTQAIEELSAQDADEEAKIDNEYANEDQATVETGDTAAENIGGAYNDQDL